MILKYGTTMAALAATTVLAGCSSGQPGNDGNVTGVPIDSLMTPAMVENLSLYPDPTAPSTPTGAPSTCVSDQFECMQDSAGGCVYLTSASCDGYGFDTCVSDGVSWTCAVPRTASGASLDHARLLADPTAGDLFGSPLPPNSITIKTMRIELTNPATNPVTVQVLRIEPFVLYSVYQKKKTPTATDLQFDPITIAGNTTYSIESMKYLYVDYGEGKVRPLAAILNDDNRVIDWRSFNVDAGVGAAHLTPRP
jgi:hypothetical protein